MQTKEDEQEDREEKSEVKWCECKSWINASFVIYVQQLYISKQIHSILTWHE